MIPELQIGQLEITESGNGNGNVKLEKVVRCNVSVYSLAAADSDDPRGSTIKGWLSVSTIVGVSLALCMC